MSNQLDKIAENVLIHCCNLKRYEKLLVICDWNSFEVAKSLQCAGENRCKESVLTMVSSANIVEPSSEPGISFLCCFDVVIYVCSGEMTHLQSRIAALQQGTRIAYLTGISTEYFINAFNNDWRKSGVITRGIASRLSAARQIRIINSAGTDLSFSTGQKQAGASDSKVSLRGTYGFLPASYSCITPLERSAEGTLAIDCTWSLSEGNFIQPLILHICNGEIITFEEHPQSHLLESYFAKSKVSVRTLIELSIGTLENSRLTGNIFKDRYSQGYVHLTFGESIHNLDLSNQKNSLQVMICKPEIFLDGRIFMADGSVE